MAFEPDKVTELYAVQPIVDYDLIEKIKSIFTEGYIIRPEDGKIALPFMSKAIEAPWVYVRSDPEKNCVLWHKIMFKHIGVFPLPCLRCWKVVVRPKTLKQLLMLLEWQEKVYTGYCKCGVEIRPFVFGNYGGYFYNSSYEEGMECYKKVREAVDEYLSPDVKVTLKRYCTEFEMRFGASDQIENSLEHGFYMNDKGQTVHIPTRKESENWEHIVNKNFDVSPNQTPQASVVKLHTIKQWFERAYDVGDETINEFTEGEDFYSTAKTYHNKEVLHEVHSG